MLDRASIVAHGHKVRFKQSGGPPEPQRRTARERRVREIRPSTEALQPGRQLRPHAQSLADLLGKVEPYKGPRESLAARILAAATDRSFPGIVTGDDNVTAGRLSSAPAILSYGLRVMHHYASGEGVNVPAAFAATLPVLGTPKLDEEAFATLTERFNAGVKREVKEGIDEFVRLSPLARQGRVWFEKTDVAGHLKR